MENEKKERKGLSRFNTHSLLYLLYASKVRLPRQQPSLSFLCRVEVEFRAHWSKKGNEEISGTFQRVLFKQRFKQFIYGNFIRLFHLYVCILSFSFFFADDAITSKSEKKIRLQLLLIMKFLLVITSLENGMKKKGELDALRIWRSNAEIAINQSYFSYENVENVVCFVLV